MSDIPEESASEPQSARMIRWLVRGAGIGAIAGVLVTLILFVIGRPSGLVAAAVVASFAVCYGVTAGLLALASRIRFDPLRVVVQSAIVGFALAPSILVGHGVAPAPAWFVLFVPGHLRFALIPMGFTAAVALPVFNRIARNARRALSVGRFSRDRQRYGHQK